MSPVIDDIKTRLSGYVYAVDSCSLQETVVRLLRRA